MKTYEYANMVYHGQGLETTQMVFSCDILGLIISNGSKSSSSKPGGGEKQNERQVETKIQKAPNFNQLKRMQKEKSLENRTPPKQSNFPNTQDQITEIKPNGFVISRNKTRLTSPDKGIDLNI